MERTGGNTSHVYLPVDKFSHGVYSSLPEGKKRLTNPAPSKDRQLQCRRTIKLALGAGNQGECHAAIERAFQTESPPTIDSHLAEILSLRTSQTLAKHGLLIVKDLQGVTEADLLALPQVGPEAVKEIAKGLKGVIGCDT